MNKSKQSLAGVELHGSNTTSILHRGNPNNYLTFWTTAQLKTNKILQIWSNLDWFGHNITSPCPEILQQIWSAPFYISG